MSRTMRGGLTVIFALVALLQNLSYGQVDLSGVIGIPEHAHTLPVRIGFVNLDNGNLHLEIPLYSNPERGHPDLINKLVYDSSFWNYAYLTGGYQAMLYPTLAGWGG